MHKEEMQARGTKKGNEVRNRDILRQGVVRRRKSESIGVHKGNVQKVPGQEYRGCQIQCKSADGARMKEYM